MKTEAFDAGTPKNNRAKQWQQPKKSAIDRRLAYLNLRTNFVS